MNPPSDKSFKPRLPGGHIILVPRVEGEEFRIRIFFNHVRSPPMSLHWILFCSALRLPDGRLLMYTRSHDRRDQPRLICSNRSKRSAVSAQWVKNLDESSSLISGFSSFNRRTLSMKDQELLLNFITTGPCLTLSDGKLRFQRWQLS